MKKLKIPLLYNNIHYYIIPIILSGLIFYNFIFGVILLLYLFFLYKSNNHFKNSVIISLVSFLVYLILFNLTFPIDNISGVVVEIDEYSVLIKRNFDYVLVYTTDFLEIGDKVVVEGSIVETAAESYSGGFNYTEYLKYNKINYVVSSYSIEVIDNVFCLAKLRDVISSFYESRMDSLSFSYFKTLILGNNILDEETYSNIILIGIAHIFSLSGFHINIISGVILYVLSLFIVDKNKQLIILNIFLVFYVLISGFSISILRASIMIILFNIGKILSLDFSKLDYLFLSIIFVLFINPFYIYMTSFYLTYLLAFVLITFDVKKDLFKVNLICFLVSLPLVINMSNSINPMTLIVGPFFILMITYLILPILYISIFFPNSYNSLFVIFENIVNNSIFQTTILYVKDINIILVIIYYILLFYIFIKAENSNYSHKYYLKFIIYVVFLVNIKYTQIYDLVTFIDVGQGDSSLIKLSTGEVILIDSFGYNYSYLKDLGIHEIDYIIITHNHSDHNDVEEILNNFEVECIITSIYDDAEYINQRIAKPTDIINISDARIEFLYPYNDSDNENNVSLVCKVYINSFSILFTGDIEEESESELVSIYGNYLNSDILKVPHHGSDTSSTVDFINCVSPEYSVISLGEDNSYGMPADSVLSALSNSTIYRTDINKNIDFLIMNNQIIARPYKK